jgi:hypothetical protein
MTGFFEEKEGVKSMGRLLSFILVVAGLAVVTIGVVFRYEQTPALAGSLFGAGILTKMVQKFAEKNEKVD